MTSCPGGAGPWLGQLGRDDESLAAFQKALAWEPTRESTLVAAAYLTTKMGRRQEAAGFWQRAIAVNPWRSDYHAELAHVYFYDGKWNAAAAACRDTLDSARPGSRSGNGSPSVIVIWEKTRPPSARKKPSGGSL